MNKQHQQILDYIEHYWQTAQTTPESPRDSLESSSIMKIGHIPLPGTFVAPNHSYFAGTQFYWDSYFTILGLVDSNRGELAKNMVDNLCFLQQKFGLVPARNSWTSLGRSQPPYLTRMAWEVYEHGSADKQWLGHIMACAEAEYDKVWTSGRRFDNTTQLSRYNPKYFGNYYAVYESGWDKSTRFSEQGADLLPIDLNCLLYQYEADFLAWAVMTNDEASQKKWKTAMIKRSDQVNSYLWDVEDGIFYDYSLRDQQRINFKTLAGFFPLWCGLASQAQADKCRSMLHVFEQKGGLSTTEALTYKNRQWDYPNGWAPLQWIVTSGLRRYGYDEDADRLTRKWLDCNLKVFNATGALWEKYDVVDCDVGLAGRYGTQPGFAWTNSMFLRMVDSLRS